MQKQPNKVPKSFRLDVRVTERIFRELRRITMSKKGSQPANDYRNCHLRNCFGNSRAREAGQKSGGGSSEIKWHSQGARAKITGNPIATGS
jgi:hypothetical protein